MRNLFNDQFDMPGVQHAASPEIPGGGGINIRGTSGDDYLNGGEGDDTIRGLGGDDELSGQAGNDQLFGGSGADDVNDTSSGSDTLFGEDGDDRLYVSRHYAEAPGATEHISMDGGEGADILTIEAYSYYVDDYPVEAKLSGGAGDDIINVYAAQHATVSGGSGSDIVNAWVGSDLTVSLGGGADKLHLEGIAAGPAIVITDFQTGDGGDVVELRDLISSQIYPWDHENPFSEGYLRLIQDGADTLLQFDSDGDGEGAGWVDLIRFQDVAAGELTAFNLDGFPSDGSEALGEVITGSSSGDDLYGGDGADTIDGLGSYDYLYGNDGSDSIDGGDGDDYLNGGYGSDTLIGGEGDDRIQAQGADKVYGGFGADSIGLTFVEGEKGVAKLDGGAGDDAITVHFQWPAKVQAIVTAGGGNDSLSLSGVGKYLVNAGSGDDQLYLAGVGDKVTLTLGDGVDQVTLSEYDDAPSNVVITDFKAGAGGDQFDLAQFMDVKFQDWDHSTNPFAAGYLRLFDQAGGPVLQWSAAADGSWSDLFVLKGVNIADLTAENLSGYAADGSAPEGSLITGTSGYDDLDGGIGPDTIIGGAGGDNIGGGSGDDSLLGGIGNDNIYAGYGADYANGGDGDDYLSDGHSGNDTLVGGKGNDQLVGNVGGVVSGAEILSGGAGDDQIYVSDSYGSLRVTASGGGGDDAIWVVGAAHATVTGGAGADRIYVQQGDAQIDAGSGDDIVSFGDVVHVRVALGDGRDQVDLGASSVTSTFELTDFGADDTLGLQDFIEWNFWTSDPFADGFLRLGQQGTDAVLQVRGDAGGWSNLLTLDKVDATSLTAKQLDDYHHGPVWLIGDAGRDKLTADAHFNHLDGGGGMDVLTGADGADVLIGGAGADHLSGKAGADVFMYLDASESTLADHDTILDLSDADTINLSRVDANSQWWGDDTFVLVDHFDHQAGELMLTYRATSDTTLIAGDTDGDGDADFEILVSGDHEDFVNFVL